jgi:hypothetical protein
MDMETLQPEDAYPVTRFLDDLRGAVWPGVGQSRTIPPYRRALQRAWLERVEYLMTNEPPSSPFRPGVNLGRTDLRPLLREQVTDLMEDIRQGLLLVRERITRAHLEDMLIRMEDALEAEVER